MATLYNNQVNNLQFLNSLSMHLQGTLYQRQDFLVHWIIDLKFTKSLNAYLHDRLEKLLHQVNDLFLQNA